MPATPAAWPGNCTWPPVPTAWLRRESTTVIGSFTGRTTLSRIGQRMPTRNGFTPKAPRGRNSTAVERSGSSSEKTSSRSTTRPPGAPRRRSSLFANRKMILGFSATTVLHRTTPSIHRQTFSPATILMSCHCPRSSRVNSKPRQPISNSTADSPTTTQAATTWPG